MHLVEGFLIHLPDREKMLTHSLIPICVGGTIASVYVFIKSMQYMQEFYNGNKSLSDYLKNKVNSWQSAPLINRLNYFVDVIGIPLSLVMSCSDISFFY